MKQFNVHLYPSARVLLINIEAETHEAAAALAQTLFVNRPELYMPKAEYVDDLPNALVDVVGDNEHVDTREISFAMAPTAFDAASLTDNELCQCLEAMRNRGWAVAAYDVAALGEGPCQDDNGDYDAESVTSYLKENREHLEEIMCNAVWETAAGDYEAPAPAVETVG